MGLSASSIMPILSKWEEYLNTHPNGDITGFAQWILGSNPPPPQDPALSPLLINRIYRILQLQSKPLVKELGLTTPEEYTMLVQTAILNRPNKKQLSQELLLEGSTGVEIIKRMISKGLLTEQPDTNDRRSMRLSLSRKGEELLLKGYTKMNEAQKDFLAPLTPEEQQQLVYLLSRLNEHHASQMAPAP